MFRLSWPFESKKRKEKKKMETDMASGLQMKSNGKHFEKLVFGEALISGTS